MTARIVKWDRRFLNLAQHVSEWSKDPSTKVGACVVDPYTSRLVSVGYNGFPMSIQDAPELYSDRQRKYRRMVHAEQNALAFAYRDVTGLSIYVTHFPCSTCAGIIIQHGIKRVVSFDPTDQKMEERWQEEFDESRNMFQEARVEYYTLQRD